MGSPMSDEMALEFALPQCAEEVPETDLLIGLCFRAPGYESVPLRVIALETLAQAAARPGPLPRLAEVQREIQRALDAGDPRLRSAARATLAAVARHEH